MRIKKYKVGEFFTIPLDNGNQKGEIVPKSVEFEVAFLTTV
jgi:hypothetical protein